MVKALAIHAIHICEEPGQENDQGRLIKPAKIKVVQPGQIFEADQEALDGYVVGGVARKATKQDIALANANDDGKIPLDPDIPVEAAFQTSSAQTTGTATSPSQSAQRGSR